MLQYGTVLVVLLSFLAAGCKKKEYPTGEAVYKGECAKCHKLNGGGGTKGPDLTDIFGKHDDQYVRDYTVDPRSFKPDSVMPPAKLEDKQLEMLMDYLKKNARKRSSADLIQPQQR